MLQLTRTRRAISLMIAVLLLAGVFGMQVFSASTSLLIPNNTPVIDGEIDDIYQYALQMPLDTVGVGCSITKAISYLFWDENYLYCCAVTYAEPTSRSAVGFFFRDSTYQSIVISADGELITCTEDDITFTLENTQYAAKSYDGYYVVEIAIALNTIHRGRVIGFHTCYFEIYDELVYSYGGYFFWNDLVFSANTQAVPNQDVTSQTETSTEFKTDTEPRGGQDSRSDTETTGGSGQDQDKGGCSSAVSAPLMAGVVFALTAATVIAARKKRDR